MTRRILTLTAALILTAIARGNAGEVVEIRLHGHFFAEPATIEVIVAVEPNASNRVLRIEADGDRMFRSTEVSLSGETDKRLHTIEFKNLPAGAYELRAEVLSGSAVRGMATQGLVVAGTAGR